MTRRDPIVDEVRKHRAAIAREFGNDIAAIVAGLEASEDIPTVSLPPRRLPTHRRAAKAGKSRRPNKALEPSRACAIMSPRRAAHLAR